MMTYWCKQSLQNLFILPKQSIIHDKSQKPTLHKAQRSVMHRAVFPSLSHWFIIPLLQFNTVQGLFKNSKLVLDSIFDAAHELVETNKTVWKTSFSCSKMFALWYQCICYCYAHPTLHILKRFPWSCSQFTGRNSFFSCTSESCRH